MMVTFISSFVFAGVLSAYIFLGRGLARQVNEESLESRTRLALFWFTQDVSNATTIAAQNPGAGVSGTLMTLSEPTLGNVYYACDWSGGAGNGKFTRQVGTTGPVLTLLTNLTSFGLGYYDYSPDLGAHRRTDQHQGGLHGLYRDRRRGIDRRSVEFYDGFP